MSKSLICQRGKGDTFPYDLANHGRIRWGDLPLLSCSVFEEESV